MIKKLLLTALPIIAFALLTGEKMSDNGRAAKTGSPGEVYCSDCHNDFARNSGGGSITIAASTMAGFQYTPGQTYSMSITVARSANSLFGVGIEALTTANVNAGTLNITDAASTQIKSATISGTSRRNIVHTLGGGASAASKVFNFSWTAPAAGTGNVTFYFAGVAANNDGDNTGDYVYSGTQLLTEMSCAISATATGVTCNGGSNGTATAINSGGAGPFTYSWLPTGGSGATATNLSAGTYTVTVTDGASSCVATTTVNITEPSAVVASAGTDQVTCAGSTINLGDLPTASGGVGSFTYDWSPANGLNNINDANPTLTATGTTTYTVVVVDGNGCSATSATSIDVLPVQPATITQNGGVLEASAGMFYEWYSTTGPISGVVSQTYAPTADGIYFVVITQPNGCTSTSPDFIFVQTGIQNQNLPNTIATFPNPASDQISFVINKANENGIVTFLDVTGRVVLTNKISEGENTIDVSTLSKGVYYLNVKNGERNSSTKVFISR